MVPESEGYKLGPGEGGMWLTSNGTTIIRLNHDDCYGPRLLLLGCH